MEHAQVIRFYGSEIHYLPSSDKLLCNTFTFELWLKADRPLVMQQEALDGITGIEGQRYVIGPERRSSPDEASIGISAGINGISVFEYAENHMPAVLVLAADLSEWTHVAVVYRDRTPYIYLNGVLARTGVESKRQWLFAPSQIGGHQYGYYSGYMSELRIWQSARTAEHIQQWMKSKLNDDEKGLHWYENHEHGYFINNDEKQKINMSVIIPSHNKYPLNALCLHTLMHQTFLSQWLEVIFLDDASSDRTSEMLVELHPSFILKRIRTASNLGRSTIRNIGIRASIGERILFLDAEMLAHPHLVEAHYQHHLQDPNRIVSSCMNLKRIYTVLDHHYSPGQISHGHHIYRHSILHRRIFRQFFHSNRSLTYLFAKNEVCQPHILEQYSYSHHNYADILLNYGNALTGFHMSWINFMTGNVSVSRRALVAAGLFDEQFIGFGMEDWELGFRLNKMGASFIHDPSALAYHQEHPISSHNVEHERANYARFQDKHPDIGVLLLTFIFTSTRSFSQLSGYIEDFQTISTVTDMHSENFKAKLMDMLKHAARLYSDGHHINALSGYQDQILMDEISEWRTTGKYARLIELYDHMMSL